MRDFSAPAPAADPGTSLTGPVWEHAAATPDRAQFARPTAAGWEPVTCARFRDDVMAAARGLAAAGVTPGARIGLLSHTRYEWTVADHAILAGGAVTVPIYPTDPPEQVAWILADADVTGCLVETDQRAEEVRAAGVPEGCWVRTLDGDLPRLDGTAVDPAEITRRVRATRADDLASIVYTSGTSGRPKGCELTHGNLLAALSGAASVFAPLFERPDAGLLLPLPLAHVLARLVQFGGIRAGVTLAYGDPRTLPRDLLSFRPGVLLAVPRMLEKVREAAHAEAARYGRVGEVLFARAEAVAADYSRALDTPAGPGPALRAKRWLFDRLFYRRLRDRLGGRCRYVISGGAPLRPDLAHALRGAGVTVLEGYGLTEASGALTVNPPDAPRPGTVGRPLPGVRLRIAADGEVLAAGDTLARGYRNHTPLTDEAGWFHTGDLGELDGAGYLRITGRKKDLIVTAGGKNVVPARLEDRLRAHPLIAHGIVVGDQRPFVSALVEIDEEAWPRWLSAHGRPADSPVAALRDDPELVAEVQRAVDDANRVVSRAEAIRAFRILPRALSTARGELTPTMKVRRAVVQREYADEIDAIYRR